MLKDGLKKTANGVKNAVISFYREYGAAGAFVTLSAFALLYYIVSVLVMGSDGVLFSFFVRGEDLMMDYFNSVRDVAQDIGVYTERHVIYPPMANLVMLVFSSFLPNAYLVTSFEDRLEWMLYPEAYASVFLYMGIPVLVLLYMCYSQYKKGNAMRALVTLSILFSYPMLFAIERGNIIVWAVVATVYFAFHYDSESPVKRECALLALAFAFSIKLYPALLGVLLLVARRYREAIRTAIYGLLMLILPSFFFGGPRCFLWIYENTQMFSAARHAYWTGEFFRYAPETLKTVSDIIPIVLAAVALLLAVLLRYDWRKIWMYGVAFFHAIPSFNGLYTWLFFLPPLLAYFGEKKLSRPDWLYVILLTVPFFATPWGDWIYHHYMVAICLLLLIAMALADTLITLRLTLRERKLQNI